VELTRKPQFEVFDKADFEFAGYVGQRVRVTHDNWVLPYPDGNPAMIETLRMRDRRPRTIKPVWAGEYAGKYLMGALRVLRLTKERKLRERLAEFVAELIEAQAPDGYLGPFPRKDRLTGESLAGGSGLWDLWGNYHCITGLLEWWQLTGDENALQAARRAADYICSRMLDGKERTIDTGRYETNQAIIHAFCLLYEQTGDERYLRMAREIEKDWEVPGAGDYVRTALEGKEFYQTPQPRWESLADLQAIAEMYFISGDEKYRRALWHIWRSIQRYERHNTGAWTSNERAVGEPYMTGTVETCCTVAWVALSVDVLRMTGESAVADEIELTTFNGIFGAEHPSGMWWTYSTPMEGEKVAFVTQYTYHALPGGPHLNCCEANAARGIGALADWAVMRADDGLVLNFYGPSEFKVNLPDGSPVRLKQTTEYPRNGSVNLLVGLEGEAKFSLRLRIPGWSGNTNVAVNGTPVDGVEAGSYLLLDRTWQDGDRIELQFDMSLYFWPGQGEYEDLTSIFRGPILLAYDQRFNSMDAMDVPILEASSLAGQPAQWRWAPKPWLVLRCPGKDGREVLLCDFATAGATGGQYRTWLAVDGVEEAGGRFAWPTAVGSDAAFTWVELMYNEHLAQG